MRDQEMSPYEREEWENEGQRLEEQDRDFPTTNYYEIGKKDGTSQFKMDELTETSRDGELLTYTALTSLAYRPEFKHLPSSISHAQYACGFVEGYLIAKCEQASVTAGTQEDEMSNREKIVTAEMQQQIEATISLLDRHVLFGLMTKEAETYIRRSLDNLVYTCVLQAIQAREKSNKTESNG